MAGLAKPVLAVADDNPGTVAELEAALTRRFGADYQVVASTDPAAVLSAVRLAAGSVALVLAGQMLQGMPGTEFLCQAHQLHPAAKRVLLVRDGDVAAGMAGLRAMALGQFDDWYWLDTR
jgi:thioredoxin reductase (NADPH)